MTLKPLPLVIYHGHCADGFTAAWAVWRRFGPAADYLPADHEARPVPNVDGREVYVLDFCFPRAQTLDLLARANSFEVIDHHDTARADLAGLPCGHFDSTKSGSVLAWERFHPGVPLPRLVEHINDRDLNVWRNPDSRAFLAWMERVPRTFANWERLVALPEPLYQKILAKGRRLLAEQHRIAKAIASHAVPVRILGAAGLSVGCPAELSPDVCRLLAAQTGTFGMTWRLLPDHRVRVLFRSVPEFNIGQIAHQLGGGGHPQSAGCVISVPELLAMLAA